MTELPARHRGLPRRFPRTSRLGLSAALWATVAAVTVTVIGAGMGVGFASAQDDARRSRAELLTAQAERLAAAGDRVSALGYFRDAIRVDAAYGPAYAGLGRLEAVRGRTSDARETYAQGLAVSPGTLELWVGAAEVELQFGDHREARALLARMAARFPNDPRAHREHGLLAERMFAWAEALAAHRALIALSRRGLSVDAAWLEEAEAHAAALEVLVGDGDPLSRCEGSEVRRALCR
jgi:tetratricopeptide (TPR) repeat protein